MLDIFIPYTEKVSALGATIVSGYVVVLTVGFRPSTTLGFNDLQ
jgi:hypothetical protein